MSIPEQPTPTTAAPVAPAASGALAATTAAVPRVRLRHQFWPRLRFRLACLLIGLAASLPYVDKAVHIDDVLYLQGAYQLLKTGDPYHGQVLWDATDGQPDALFTTDFNPPLWKFLLAGVIWCTTDQLRDLQTDPQASDRMEAALHYLQLGVVLLAALSVGELARRWTALPLWTTAFIFWSPFFLPGQNLMLEPPLLALWSLALLCQHHAWTLPRKEKTQTLAAQQRTVWPVIGWSLVAGLLAGFCLLIKYTGILLLPLFLLGAWVYRRPWTLLALLPAGLLLTSWLFLSFWVYGAAHLFLQGLKSTHGITDWPTRGLIVCRTLGAVLWLGPWWGYFALRQRRYWPMLLFALVSGLLLAVLDGYQANQLAQQEGWRIPPLQWAHYLIFTTQGVFLFVCLAYATRTTWRTAEPVSPSPGLPVVTAAEVADPLTPQRDTLFLLGWVCLILVFNVVSVPFHAVRHVLLLAIPYTFLFVRQWHEPLLALGYRFQILGLSTLLGLALAAADYELANMYKQVATTHLGQHARRLQANHRSQSNVGLAPTIWFTGNWGFYYYAAQQPGCLPLLQQPTDFGFPPVRPGDLIYHPILLTWKGLPQSYQLQAVEHLQPPASQLLLSALRNQPPRSLPSRCWWGVCGFLGQYCRTVTPGVHYYAVLRHSLPWQILILPADADSPDALYQLPNLDDIAVYQIQAIQPPINRTAE